MSVALLGGFAGSAFAQQGPGGPPPQGSAVTQTVTTPEKPWAHDPTYVRQIENYQQQERLRVQSYTERANLQIRAEDERYTSQMAQVTAQYPKNHDWRTLSNYGARVNQINSAHELRHNSLVQAERQYLTQEQIREAQYVENLDKQMERLPQYKSASPTTQPAVRAAPTNTTKSPQEMSMHDKLVKKYNDDYFRIAGSGKPLPDPAKYGLQKDDPGIYPNNQNQQSGPATAPSGPK